MSASALVVLVVALPLITLVLDLAFVRGHGGQPKSLIHMPTASTASVSPAAEPERRGGIRPGEGMVYRDPSA